jgi:DNA-binding transcriptional ArsR family regulator
MREQELGKIFAALGNETRAAIFEYVRSVEYDCESDSRKQCEVPTANRTVCVTHISRKFSHMGASAISQHLKTLHGAGLLNRHKMGPWVYFTINHGVLARLRQYFSEPPKLDEHSTTSGNIVTGGVVSSNKASTLRLRGAE